MWCCTFLNSTTPPPQKNLMMFLEKLFVPNDDILKLIMFGLITQFYVRGVNTKKVFFHFVRNQIFTATLDVFYPQGWRLSYMRRILLIMLAFVSYFNHGLNDMVCKIIPVKIWFTVNKKTYFSPFRQVSHWSRRSWCCIQQQAAAANPGPGGWGRKHFWLLHNSHHIFHVSMVVANCRDILHFKNVCIRWTCIVHDLPTPSHWSDLVFHAQVSSCLVNVFPTKIS